MLMKLTTGFNSFILKIIILDQDKLIIEPETLLTIGQKHISTVFSIILRT